MAMQMELDQTSRRLQTDGVCGANYQIQTQGLWSPQIPSIAKSAHLD